MNPPTFTLGKEKLSLRDLHQGVGVYGGLGTGKTVAFLLPIIRQFFNEFNGREPQNQNAPCGAFILDEMGDMIELVRDELAKAGRPADDLVEISLNSETTYNPFDTDETKNSEDDLTHKKIQIQKILGRVPELPKQFQGKTTLSFQDIPNKGKIVVFNGAGLSKADTVAIGVALKTDFQKWQKRRLGSAAAAFGLNTSRTVLFLCDEFQEFVTCGDEGDETFFGLARAAKTACIIASQAHCSLQAAIRNEAHTQILCLNIGTWVFFRSTDPQTAERGHFLVKGCKPKMFQAVPRQEDFRSLVTRSMDKTKTGPWYSEAIIYRNTNPTPTFRKTKLPHLYFKVRR